MQFIRNTLLGTLGCACLFSLAPSIPAADRPNFLWILSEDSSQHFFRLYHPRGASTPHIQRLADQGLTFEHAFSCSPVCSVARTTLMTGVYAPRIGAQFHRPQRPVTLPDGWKLFPAYLREAGYYTSNNAKTDYNVQPTNAAWNESSRRASWRNRPDPQSPFLHMATFTTSHESSLHFSRENMAGQPTITDPQSVELADYHPDTPLFRYTYARYHDRIREMDRQIGQLMRQLTEDGLLEDTFVFYFGDHGGVLPGSKGYLKETGLHIPLVVRIPQNWRHLVDAEPGQKLSGFVSFVDLAPTVLHLAGLTPPAHLDGLAFLGRGISGQDLQSRREAYGYADRFDEKCEMVRSLRRDTLKYVRYFEGFYPDALQNNYRYKMLAYEEWRSLYRQGKLSQTQAQFFSEKPAEALFDLSQDPYEINDLSRDPDRQKDLLAMRQQLRRQMVAWPDLSLYPESFLVEEAVGRPIHFARSRQEEIAKLAAIANLALPPYPEVEHELRAALQDTNRWVRYWAVTACRHHGQKAAALAEWIEPLTQDPEPMVQMRAAETLAHLSLADPRPVLKTILRQTTSPAVALAVLNSVVALSDGPQGWEFSLVAEDVAARNGQVERRLEYLLEH